GICGRKDSPHPNRCPTVTLSFFRPQKNRGSNAPGFQFEDLRLERVIRADAEDSRVENRRQLSLIGDTRSSYPAGGVVSIQEIEERDDLLFFRNPERFLAASIPQLDRRIEELSQMIDSSGERALVETGDRQRSAVGFALLRVELRCEVDAERQGVLERRLE